MSRIAKTVGLLGTIAALAACDGEQPFSFNNPDDSTDPAVPDPGAGTPAGVPAELARNLSNVSYNANSGVLIVDMQSLDSGDPDAQTMIRRAGIDEGTYDAYTFQDDAFDRFVLAYAKQTPDNAVQGVLAVDGGQFTKYFGGGYYSNDSSVYTQPTSGLVSYAGDYVAITNISAPAPSQLITPPSGASPDILPGEPIIITGDIFINADFSDLEINGGVFNRQLEQLDGATFPTLVLLPVYLTPTTIEADGTFLGDVEDVEQSVVGTYGGTFGGSNASGLAGTLYLDRGFTDAFDNEEETGLFVLVQCGEPGDSALCSGANPL